MSNFVVWMLTKRGWYSRRSYILLLLSMYRCDKARDKQRRMVGFVKQH